MSLDKRFQNNPMNNPNFFKKCIETSKRRSKEKQDIYKENPNKCNYCFKIIDYEKRENKYCSRTCSAKANNALRTKEQHGKRIEKIREVSKTIVGLSKKQRNRIYAKRSKLKKKGLYDVEGEFSYLYFIRCKDCGKIFTYNKGSKKYCIKCKLKNIKEYRFACQFNLNAKQHSFLFKNDLIKKYGWYNATNNKVKKINLNGLTWDHLFRIEDGFMLGVLPVIMNHPANAELIPWSINRKRTKSMISLDELKERICLYESGKFAELKNFYKDD